MAEDIRNAIRSYLNGHLYGNIATINSNDYQQPHVSTVAYVNEGFDLYFITSAKTQKFADLGKNPKVAITIDEDEPDWMKITGLQFEGVAEVVNAEQAPSIFEIYAEKFPIAKAFPPNPDYRFIKITPKRIWLLDYRKGFGHRDYLEL